ncbi:GDP-mannose 4,6-dehydratase [subsurface metagenome]
MNFAFRKQDIQNLFHRASFPFPNVVDLAFLSLLKAKPVCTNSIANICKVSFRLQIARIEKGLAEPVIKVGNISVQRDFLDVRDVVKAYALLMEKGKTGEVYNVCSGKSVLLKEILNILLSFSSKAIEIQVDSQKLRKSDISLLFGDNQKIKQELSWEPKITLKQSLFDLLEYWRGKVKSEE